MPPRGLLAALTATFSLASNEHNSMHHLYKKNFINGKVTKLQTTLVALIAIEKEKLKKAMPFLFLPFIL